MRKTVILLLLLLPAMAFAQSAAVEFLDKAVAAMKADAAVQMDYSSTVYDEDGKAVQTDKGVMRLDGNRYSLLMDEMKVWCNGNVQWSYMSSVNEIYITDAASDEAQNMSPLYIMEKFRDGFDASMEKKGPGRPLPSRRAAHPGYSFRWRKHCCRIAGRCGRRVPFPCAGPAAGTVPEAL